MFDCLLKQEPAKFNNLHFLEHVKKEKLGLGDLKFTESEIWNDLENGTESYVFEKREMTEIDLCLSAFYNYDTSEEMNVYRNRHGKDMERVAEIFINIFPYKNQSVLLKGYHKKDENKVKGYFYSFFKESEKKVQRKLTNLMLFQCETWVVSDKLFTRKIKGIEGLFADAVSFSIQNLNERRNFDLNSYKDDFKSSLEHWNKIYVG